MKTKEKSINLLPKEYITAEMIQFYQKVGVAVLAVEVACFALLIAMPAKKEVERTQQLLLAKQAEANSERYAGVNRTLKELEDAKTQMSEWQQAYAQLKYKDEIGTEMIDELVGRVPEGVIIQQLSVKRSEDGNKEITIKGTCQEFNQCLNFVSRLETIYPAHEISHELESDEDAENYEYQIQIKEEVQKVVANQNNENEMDTEEPAEQEEEDTLTEDGEVE